MRALIFAAGRGSRLRPHTDWVPKPLLPVGKYRLWDWQISGLKKAGMVATREGQDGGYRLCVDPATLSLRQVAEAVNTRFVDCAWHSGDIDRDCAICSGMAGVMDALYRQMNEQCAAYLSHITITDIETQLFAQK